MCTLKSRLIILGTLALAEVATAQQPSMNRQIAPEQRVFAGVRDAIVRIDAGLTQGTAFVVDAALGLAVTNDHVLADGRDLTVTFGDSLKVTAVPVVRDRFADIAVVAFVPAACPACPSLAPSTTPVAVGERVLTVGFPLGHNSTMTSGMVARVDSEAILVDLNVNPGNSGGPLVNFAGDVVGVITFVAQDDRGQGLTGAMPGARALVMIDAASVALDALPSRSSEHLPLMPRRRYPLAALEMIADTARLNDWDELLDIGVGPFSISFSTPVSHFVSLKALERSIARDRQQREAQAGVPVPERYSQTNVYHDWDQYVGDITAPVVGVSVRPTVGETGGSLAGKLFVGLLTGVAQAVSGVSQATPMLPTTMRFRGDLQEVSLRQNDNPVPPIRGGRQLLQVLKAAPMFDMRDVAYGAYYVFEPAAFAPDSSGTPPELSLTILDLKAPLRTHYLEVPPAVAARIWNSFELYYRAVMPGTEFVRADPNGTRWMAVLGRPWYYRRACVMYSPRLPSGGVVSFPTRDAAERAGYRLAPRDGCEIPNR